jgi:hypothetical protein
MRHGSVVGLTGDFIEAYEFRPMRDANSESSVIFVMCRALPC